VQPPGVFSSSISIIAAPARVLWAFFDPGALSCWWQAARSVTSPRIFGPYAVEWDPTEFRDDILGRLGGTFHGRVMDFRPDRGFFVADAYWMPPDGNPIGPMGLEVVCEHQRRQNPQITIVTVTQRGTDEGERWKRYYEIIAPGWHRALESLKRYLERTD
jgi:hypothetical protein